MEPFQWAMVTVGVLGFLINYGLVVSTVTSKINGMESRLRQSLIENKGEVDEEFAKVRREIGESLQAIRTKVNEVELWARDEFVRKGSFTLVTGEVKELVAHQTVTIDRRLEQMAGKIEALQIAVASAGVKLGAAE